MRYRIEWARGGKRRAEAFRCAQAVARERPELKNDPSRRSWEVVVALDERSGAVDVEVSPRLPDPRFSYRLGDVPAASHPTLAAALVFTAGNVPGDVVWDPFVGSGTELAERALAGPYAELHGSDVEPEALSVARRNLEAAGVPGAVLSLGDAFQAEIASPPGVTLVITNPPMGRRVLRASDLGALYDRFLARIPRAPSAPAAGWSGFLPLPARTADHAASLGFVVEPSGRSSTWAASTPIFSGSAVAGEAVGAVGRRTPWSGACNSVQGRPWCREGSGGTCMGEGAGARHALRGGRNRLWHAGGGGAGGVNRPGSSTGPDGRRSREPPSR